MTNEEIMSAAEEADDYADGYLQSKGEYHPDWHTVRDERFAAIIKRKTIERCAVVCDGFANSHNDQQMIAAMNCAAAIRKLGEQ